MPIVMLVICRNMTFAITENIMKLKINDVILVHGWVMLKGLEDGQKYRVQSTPDYYGNPTYQFTKAKGKKFICRHETYSVDMMIDERNLNRIEKVQ